MIFILFLQERLARCLILTGGSLNPGKPVDKRDAYTGMPDATWEISVYPGKDGKFTVYEDEGDNYNYQTGKSATFNLTWDNKKHELTINDKKGSFDAMIKNRLLNFVLVNNDTGTGISEAEGKKIEYTGLHTVINL